MLFRSGGAFTSRLAAVTKADVKRVSKAYLAPGRSRVVAVGDAKLVREEIAPLAAGD